jgi:CRISPR-associated protein Cas6
MIWEDEGAQAEEIRVPDDIVDLSFRIACRCLPVDHAHALFDALADRLDWLSADEVAGVHVIHGAASGNGWYRPEESLDDLIHLSRRTRLTLRLPAERVSQAEALTGATLDVAGYALEVGEGSIRSLSRTDTLYARYVLGREVEDEEIFLADALEQLQAMGLRVRKALCGRVHRIRTPKGDQQARSLMVAELKPEEAFELQRRGLGEGRKLGCGLFIPHKGIKAVKTPADEDRF